MGKGDKKSKRGKIYRGTFGKRRHRKKAGFIPLIVKNEEKKSEEKKPVEPKPEVKAEKQKPVRKKAEKKVAEKEKPAKE